MTTSESTAFPCSVRASRLIATLRSLANKLEAIVLLGPHAVVAKAGDGMLTTHVKISDAALESMCHASLEAYLYGAGHSKRPRVEVDGYLWGWRRDTEDHQLLFVDRMSPSLSSNKHEDWVRPNPEAAAVQVEFMEHWAPEIAFLGDFHSHPYDDLKTVQSNKGYQFSPQDFDYLQNDEFIWQKTADRPLITVMTVCKLSRVHLTKGSMVSGNIWRWDVGEYRFWLNAAVGHLDEGERGHSGNTNSAVFLDLNTRFFNISGGRLGV